MTFIRVVATSGLVGALALIILGVFGWGRGRWWGIGRLRKSHAVLMGVAFGLLDLQWLVSLSDTARIVMGAASLALMITVIYVRWASAPS